MEDLNLIRLLYEEKGWHGTEICRGFPGKRWNSLTVNYTMNKLEEMRSIQRKPGTGRVNRSVHTEQNEEVVEGFVCSQESDHGTHQYQREVGNDIRASQESVNRILRNTGLKSFSRLSRSEVRDGSILLIFHISKKCMYRW